MELQGLLENFKSESEMANACEREWCYSPISGKIKQIMLAPKGVAYPYACRYEVEDGAVAIIGHGLPTWDGGDIEKSANAGIMGIVQEISPTLTIKRKHAVEVDYVFNQGVSKKRISNCAKFLSFGKQDYVQTLQFGKLCSPIRPIRYYIQRILSAASILAFPTLATAEDLKNAKKAILEKKKLDNKMNNWPAPSLDAGVDLTDVQICDFDILNVFEKIASLHEDFEDGETYSDSTGFAALSRLGIVNDFIEKYAHIGAVAIMVRGGFLNLLKAYLSVNTPIAEFHERLCELLAGATHTEAYNVLASYGK